jgi:hypothetical protein
MPQRCTYFNKFLEQSWYLHQCKIAGTEVPRFVAKSDSLQDLRFVKGERRG